MLRTSGHGTQARARRRGAAVFGVEDVAADDIVVAMMVALQGVGRRAGRTAGEL